ncbi:MAG: O-antigen ligase family protein [Firmicutes bacterium]|nr:O-antigen ligase family protein [Bacillota bacterium]
MGKYKELNCKILSINKQRGIIDILAYISILTSSFDILFNVKIYGFSFRFTQLCAIILFFAFLFKIIKTSKIMVPVYFKFLFIYGLLNAFFILNSKYISNAIGYALWLILNISQLFMYVNLFKNRNQVIQLLKIYFISFVIISIIGIFQHIAMKTGVGTIILLNSKYDRIHGFSYEPSYYATYLLPGWCAILYYIEKKNFFLFSEKQLKIFFIIISLALIFSFSRMGMIIAFWYLMFRVAAIFGKMKNNNGTLKISTRNITVFAGLCFVIFSVTVYIVFLYKYQYTHLKEMVSGLGILGTAGHSSATRMNSLEDTLNIFYKSPIIGCSLGDLDGRIANSLGIHYSGQTGLSMSIIAEQFAATGIFGGVCFVIYILKIGVIYKRIKNNMRYGDMLKGICFGYIAQVILLNMNQNVLRQYFWINLAIISVIYSCRNFFEKEREALEI